MLLPFIFNVMACIDNADHVYCDMWIYSTDVHFISIWFSICFLCNWTTQQAWVFYINSLSW